MSTKSESRELADKAKGYMSGKVPRERREQTIWRLKKMIIEIQGHADCKHSIVNLNLYEGSLTNSADQQAIETLLTMAEKYAGHTKDASQQGGSAARGFKCTDNVEIVEQNMRVSA